MNSDIRDLFKCLVCQQKLNETNQQMHLPSFNLKCNRCNSHNRKSKRHIRSPLISNYKRRSDNKSIPSRIVQMTKILAKISNDIDNGQSLLIKHCNNLKKKVVSSAEQTIKQINEQSDYFLNQIENYKVKCQLAFNNIYETIINSSEIQSFINDKINKTKCSKSGNHHFFKESNKKALECIIQLETKLEMIENIISNMELIDFKVNECELEEDFLGKIYTKELTSKTNKTGNNALIKIISLKFKNEEGLNKIEFKESLKSANIIFILN